MITTKMLPAIIMAGILSIGFLKQCQCRTTDGDGLSDYVRYDGKWKLEGWNKLPGFKARITQRGLDFVKNVGMKMVEEKLGQINIPNMRGKDYDVYGMRISMLNIPEPSLQPNSQVQGMDLQASGIRISVLGNFDYSWGPFSGGGDFKATASDISLSLTLRIGVDAFGRPKVMSKGSDCMFHLGGFVLDIDASWIVRKFKDKIIDRIRSTLNSEVCPKVVSMVNTDLEGKLQSLAMIFPVENVIEVDYSLIQSPTFYGSIDTQHKGEVYSVRGKSECPLPIQAIPEDPDASRMVILWITEYLPNSAGYVMQKFGSLHYTLTPQNVPAEYKKYMNTSGAILAFVSRKIGKMFPNMGLQVELASTQAPVVNITPSYINPTFVGTISPSAILPNKTLAPLFSLNVSISTTLDVSTKRNNITWKLATLSTEMSLVRSDVGPVNVDMLQKTFDLMIKPVFIAKLNAMGAVGVPLPQVDGFTFTRPTITLGKGYLKVGTDLTYTPQ